jgi:HPt (histidine-containing phosphotransfer) domain-containing protein
LTNDTIHFDPSASRLWSLPDTIVELASEDPELIPDLIEAFTTDTAERIRQISAALAVADFAPVRAQGHAIKGGARQIGAHTVAEASQQIEAAGESQDAALAGDRLALLREVFEHTCCAMKDYCGRHAADASTSGNSRRT